MRQPLALILLEGDNPDDASTRRSAPVRPEKVSTQSRRKCTAEIAADGLPARSLPALLDELNTLTLDTVCLPENPKNRFTITAVPTPLQCRVFDLRNVDPERCCQ